MIARGQGIHFACFGVDAFEIRAAFFRGHDEYEAAVVAPERLRWTAASRRSLIAANAAGDVVVVVRSEVFWSRAGLQ